MVLLIHQISKDRSKTFCKMSLSKLKVQHFTHLKEKIRTLKRIYQF